MKDPLTPAEYEAFLQQVRKTFNELYQEALKSGALPPLNDHDHNLAKCILLITTTKFLPTTKAGKKLLKSLEKLV